MRVFFDRLLKVLNRFRHAVVIALVGILHLYYLPTELLRFDGAINEFVDSQNALLFRSFFIAGLTGIVVISMIRFGNSRRISVFSVYAIVVSVVLISLALVPWTLTPVSGFSVTISALASLINYLSFNADIVIKFSDLRLSLALVYAFFIWLATVATLRDGGEKIGLFGFGVESKPNPKNPLAAEIERHLESASVEKRLIILTLQSLIDETRSRARLFLNIILFLLLSGVLIIAFAGLITNLDLTASNVTSAEKAERGNLEASRVNKLRETEEIQLAQVKLSRTLNSLGLPLLSNPPVDGVLITSNSGPFIANFRASEEEVTTLWQVVQSSSEFLTFLNPISDAVDVVERAVAERQIEIKSESIPPSERANQIASFITEIVAEISRNNFKLNSIATEVGIIDIRLDTVIKTIQSETDAQLEILKTSGPQSTNVLIASGITRFGMVTIIVFIIQVLVGLYRYNMRLSSFYSGRLNAFIIGDTKDRDIDFFKEYFDTGAIVFGKDVANPMTDISEVMRKGFEEAGKVWSKSGKSDGST